MTEKIDIPWTRSDLLYMDLSLFGEGYEEEIFIFNDGECWVVLQACFDGDRVAHMTDEDGAEFEDIEAARLYAERMIANYEAQAIKEEAQPDSSN